MGKNIEYFRLEKWVSDTVLFNSIPIPSNNSPEYFEVFKDLEVNEQEFVKYANELFNNYSIRIPSGYEKKIDPDDFAICVGCCIRLKKDFNIDIEKIIRNELIQSNSEHSIHHAATLSLIALYYAKKKYEVKIIKEQKTKKTPDLSINNINCEVKVIKESDWTREFDVNTGKSKVHNLSEDLCFDIGKFIESKDHGHKGIKQADLIFADLTSKSIGWVNKKDNFNEFPTLKRNRIIFFSRRILNFSGYYIDIDPILWNKIKSLEQKHYFSIIPWNRNVK